MGVPLEPSNVLHWTDNDIIFVMLSLSRFYVTSDGNMYGLFYL